MNLMCLFNIQLGLMTLNTVIFQDEEALHVNFLPMDIEVENSEALPDILLHPHNLRIVQKFVREWQRSVMII